MQEGKEIEIKGYHRLPCSTTSYCEVVGNHERSATSYMICSNWHVAQVHSELLSLGKCVWPDHVIDGCKQKALE